MRRAELLRSVAASSLLCGTGAAALAQEPARLALGAMPTDGAAEAVYAEELGYLKAGGLEVNLSILSNPSAIAAAVAGKTLQIGFGTVTPLAEARARGIDFKIIWPAVTFIGPPSPNLIMVAKNSTARGAADLNGKMIAVNGLGDLSQYEVQAWVDKNGGDVRSIKLVEIPFSEMGTALAQGRVEAAILAEPFVTGAKGIARILGDPNPAIAPHYAISCWFALAEWLATNGAAARRFAATMQRTARWANKNRPKTAEILARHSKISLETALVMTRPFYCETPPEPGMFQPVLNIASKYGTLPPTNAADLIWHAG
jgi:NitT/TauT family transport system substrate-binding protein